MAGEKRSDLRDAWRLAKPYWRSEERRSAWLLLIAVFALYLGNVGVDVLINKWTNLFFNAIQQYDAPEFFRQLGIFTFLATVAIVFYVYAVYLQQMLQIRWRRWLTKRYLAAWLADRSYYRLERQGVATDNPDQRIAEDLQLFTDNVLGLSLGLSSSVVSMVAFLIILWGLSGPADLPLGPLGHLYIPGYLDWAGLIYAGAGTWLTIRIGRRLVPLNFRRQRYEADFRFSMVRLRENAESVAFYGGEPVEYAVFTQRFENVFGNFILLMRRRKLVNWLNQGYIQLAFIFPYLVVAPRYFAKAITYGGMMQVVDAFSSLQNALSFIISSYPDIAAWQAVTERLAGFERRLQEIEASIRAPQTIVVERAGAGLALRGLDLDLPDGAPLLRGLSFAAAPGEAVLLVGPSGSGKSTVLRACAGLWPFGRGQVRLGAGRVFFLPQRPYLPLGTLRQALIYPRRDAGPAAAELRAVLDQVALGHLAAELDTAENWAMQLSLGEQQRLAIARVLLVRPDILFLDEATSALDERSEAALYRLLREAAWRPTIVTVGHRASLRDLHDRTIDIADFAVARAEMQAVAE
jgi:vitamin B12/bleomycin/antimicrobial peptide transport system ATP-binding/permease protein